MTERVDRPSEAVARRVKAACADQGITGAQLAERCAELGASTLTRDAIASITSGRRRVDVDELVQLGAALNITANILLIPFYGLYGAAAATLLTWGVHMVICCAVAWREHRTPLRVGSFAVMSGLAAAVFAASEAARLEAWLPQVALDGAWVLLFAALCFGFALSAEEQRRVRDAALAGLARVRAARTGLPVRGRR